MCSYISTAPLDSLLRSLPEYASADLTAPAGKMLPPSHAGDVAAVQAAISLQRVMEIIGNLPSEMAKSLGAATLRRTVALAESAFNPVQCVLGTQELVKTMAVAGSVSSIASPFSAAAQAAEDSLAFARALLRCAGTPGGPPPPVAQASYAAAMSGVRVCEEALPTGSWRRPLPGDVDGAHDYIACAGRR